MSIQSIIPIQQQSAFLQPLPVEKLYQPSTLANVNFQTSQELADFLEFIGQERALRAIRFGVNMGRQGYNIFAVGETGTGKRSLVLQTIESRASTETMASDWCYVNNFDEPHRPWALQLPAGVGKQLRNDMARLIEDLQSTLTTAFESEEVQARRQRIAQEFRNRQEATFEKLQEKARKKSLSLLKTPEGLTFAPMRNGEVMPPDELERLPSAEKNRIQHSMEALQNDLQKAMYKMPSWERELRKRIRALDQETAGVIVNDLIDDLRQKYGQHAEVLEYLQNVQKDVIEHVNDFVELAEKPSSEEEDMVTDVGDGNPHLRRYQVNVLVDSSSQRGAPVIYESNPTYLNLVGRVEQMVQMGALVTDFLLIKPGVLHRANGGYLILDTAKVLSNPYAWEGLKRALQFREVRIETPIEMLNMSSTMSLEPEPIPIDVKVVLLGDPGLYYALAENDIEFNELFKVVADFDDEVERTADMEGLYARLLATIARREKLRLFDKSAICRVIEESSRMAGDAERLTTRMQNVVDLLEEADYCAGVAGVDVISACHVQQAVDAQIERADRIPQRIRQEVLRNTVLIDTAGGKVGQINGLAVISMGGFSFGEPMRITATIGVGKGDVVNIEREVELSGPTHSKGVLILSSFLRSRYASEQPLSLSASLVFEQSYGEVDGDSASSTELYALLSAIARAPIRQSFAVTGSVNQFGQVQAIGGVNEKIEGFFDLCQARGLSGEQGVIIPAANVKHLMLRNDVIKAVQAGKFAIYAVETIDQGIELLTGLPAGEMGADGRYPEGSLNRLVANRLDELAAAMRRFEYGDEE